MKRKELMRKIQVYDFAMQEAALYLNSHPDDQNALQYYHEYETLRKQATELYEKCFGPLTNRSDISNVWSYVYEPWPWESED